MGPRSSEGRSDGAVIAGEDAGASRTLRALVALTAAATPAIVLGPAAVAVAVVAALLLYPAMPGRAASLERLRGALTTPVVMLVLLTFATWLPNVLSSLEPMRSFTAVARTLVYVGAAAVLWSALRGDEEDRAVRLLPAFTFAAVGIALVAILIAPELISLLRYGEWKTVPAPIWLKASAAQAVLVVPVILLAGKRHGTTWRLVGAGAVVGLVALVWLTNNRSSMAGLLAILVVWAALGSSRQRHPGRTMAALLLALAVAAGVVGWLYVTRAGPAVFEVDLFAPRWLIDSHRQEIWRYAWELGEGHRWFGVGANAIDRLANAAGAVHIPGTNADRLPGHPHNWPIEIAVETGLVGLAALVALIAAVTARLLRDFRRDGDDAVLATLLVWTGFWTAGLFNFSFWSSWWQASFLVVTAICLAARRDLPRQGLYKPATRLN